MICSAREVVRYHSCLSFGSSVLYYITPGSERVERFPKSTWVSAVQLASQQVARHVKHWSNPDGRFVGAFGGRMQVCLFQG